MSPRRYDARSAVPLSTGERSAVRRSRSNAASASFQAFWKADVPAYLRHRRYNAHPSVQGLMRRNQLQARAAVARMVCAGHRYSGGCEKCGPHGKRRILQTIHIGPVGHPSVDHFETWTVVHVGFRSSGHQLSWSEISNLHCHGVFYEINPDYRSGEAAARGAKYIVYYLRRWNYPRREMMYQVDRRPRDASGSVISALSADHSARTGGSGTLQLGLENGFDRSARREKVIRQLARQLAAQRVPRHASRQRWAREFRKCMDEMRDIEIPKHRAFNKAESYDD